MDWLVIGTIILLGVEVLIAYKWWIQAEKEITEEFMSDNWDDNSF